MFKAICGFIFHTILGWRILGVDRIKAKKCVIVVAPHTSYWDFPIGVLVRPLVDMNAKFLIKSELFRNPIVGWFLKYMGGIPVDRKKKNSSLVQQVITAFDENEKMCLALAPEGTRSLVKDWKKGFYRIAMGAQVPIVLCSFDFVKKEVNFLEERMPSGDANKEIPLIRSKFIGFQGKRPELGVHE